jgi:hypothetical protein
MKREVPRIDAAEARERTRSGRALLVCAYDDDQKCRSMLLAGAIPKSELERRGASLDATREIILYCA